jgi:hypothetical protein
VQHGAAGRRAVGFGNVDAAGGEPGTIGNALEERGILGKARLLAIQNIEGSLCLFGIGPNGDEVGAGILPFGYACVLSSRTNKSRRGGTLESVRPRRLTLQQTTQQGTELFFS